MDVFSIFSGSVQTEKKAEKKKQTSGSYRGGLVQRKGLVVRLRDESVLFFDDDSVQEVFIPRSQIKDWWFTSDGSKRTLSVADLELDDEITLVIPRWLAIKEGMV